MAKKKTTKIVGPLSKLCERTSNDISKFDKEAYDIEREICNHLKDLTMDITVRYAAAITDYLDVIDEVQIEIELESNCIVIEARKDSVDDNIYVLNITIMDNKDHKLIRCYAYTNGCKSDYDANPMDLDEYLSIFPAIRYLNEQFDTYIENKITTECTALLNKNAAYRSTIQNIREDIGQYTLKIKSRELEHTIDANLQ